MKILNLFGALAISALTMSAALANSTVCASSDSKLSFSQHSSNGGPALRPTESLILNGETLISITFPGGADLKLADTNFADQPVWSQTSYSGNTRTTLSVKSLSVTRLDASGSALPVFNELVFCRDDVYVGPPIP